MKKNIIVATLALGCSLIASENTISVDKFLEKTLKSNPQISNLKITIEDTKNIEGLKGWKAENVRITADLKRGKNIQKINEYSTFFTNGRFLVDNMTDMKTGEKLLLEKKFDKKYYNDENLISGNKNSLHRVVIFSDPLCPFCKRNVPKSLRILKKYPEKFAVYYYDLPLENLHPASKTIVKINEKIRSSNKKISKIDAIMEMYDLDINANTRNENQILNAYNTQLGYKIKLNEINTKEIDKKLKNSLDIANKMGIKGTPTFYFDEKKDRTESFKKYIK